MFGRGNRFDSEKGDGTPHVEYLTFSDFIRQQFLKQRNIFDSTSERPKTAVGKVEKYLHDQYATYKDAEVKKPRPKTAGAADNKLSINTSLLHQEPETNFSSPPRPKKKPHAKKRATSSTQIAVDGEQNSSARHGIDLHPPMPGPGQYYQPSSLLKPSFNRVYTEPEPALPLSKASALAQTIAPHYTRPTASRSNQQHHGGNQIDQERVEYRPAWDLTANSSSTPKSERTMNEDEKAKMWETYKGAYFNKAKLRLRSAPPSSQRRGPSMTSQIAWADDEALKEAFPLTFKVKNTDQILSNEDGAMLDRNTETNRPPVPKTKIAQQTESLYGKRYPPLSDDQMKRWESVDHTTYVNKSHQKLPIAMRLVAGKVANRTKKNHFS